MPLFTGITLLYGSNLQYALLATLVWGWIMVSFLTWFVGIAMAEICSSFPFADGWQSQFSAGIRTIVVVAVVRCSAWLFK